MGFTVFSQARSILSFANFSYLISCSKLSNTSALKNSPSVISKPSHSFLIVLMLNSFRLLSNIL